MASLHPCVRMILTAYIETEWRESHQQELPCQALHWKMCAYRLRRLRRLRTRAAEMLPSSRLLRRRSGESARTNPALREKTRSALSLVAELLLAECCLPRCCQLCPDGWM